MPDQFDPAGVTGKMELRYAVFSTLAGVYLGETASGAPRWSRRNPGAVTTAPTFNKTECEKVMLDLRERDECLGTLVPKMVFPDKGTDATMGCLADTAGLPRWEPRAGVPESER